MSLKKLDSFVPVNEPLLDGNELDYLAECIKTGWISSEGPFVERFEKELASYVGRSFGIAVSSGTGALEIAVAALELQEYDEVILPTHTIISCANALIKAGVRPVLVDTDPDTWNMDLNQIYQAINAKTKAIMVVHTFGLPVDMDPIYDLAKNNGLRIIEDTSQAIGVRYKKSFCGSLGDISVMSFYSNKHITTGEGGMLLCDDVELANRCRSFRNLCFQESKRFVHEAIGWNYRMSNLSAAVGVAQLEKLEDHLQIKRQNGLYYREQLKAVEQLVLPPEDQDYATNPYWAFGVMLNNKSDRTATSVTAALKDRGIGTRPFFWPLHEQPIFRRMNLFMGETYPVAEMMGRNGFYLPSGMALTQVGQIKVVNELLDIVA